MSMKKQVTITLPNKVGELAKLCRSLAENGVNIEAISVTNLIEAGVVRFVPSDPAKAKKALKGIGATVTIEDVLAVSLPNDPGALAEAAAKLQKNKINVDYVYGSVSSQKSEKAVCIFKTSDLKATAELLV